MELTCSYFSKEIPHLLAASISAAMFEVN